MNEREKGKEKGNKGKNGKEKGNEDARRACRSREAARTPSRNGTRSQLEIKCMSFSRTTCIFSWFCMSFQLVLHFQLPLHAVVNDVCFRLALEMRTVSAVGACRSIERHAFSAENAQMRVVL